MVWIDRTIEKRHAFLGFCLDCVLAISLFSIVGKLVIIIQGVFLPWPKNLAVDVGHQSSDHMMIQLAWSLCVMALTSYFVYRIRCPATQSERGIAYRAAYEWRTWQFLIVGAVGVLLINIIATKLIGLLGVHVEPTNAQWIRQALQQSPTLLIFFVVVLAPLYEELFFRRVLFGRFARAQQAKLGGVLSSFIFAFMHELPGQSMNGWLGLLSLWLIYGAIGCVLAWVYLRSQALWASVVVHCCNNFVALLLLFLQPSA